MALTLVGCATYQSQLSPVKNKLENNEPDAAINGIKEKALKPSDDQLAYLLEYATVLQMAGKYQDSNKYFLEADQMAEQKDYHSVTRIGGSLLFNEGMVQYKGADYEKMLINVMTAINFSLLGDNDAALVEVRRINEKLEYYRLEEKKDYTHNAFALYLSAMLWESDRNWDSAFIDYMRAYDLDPTIPNLDKDLLALAKVTDRLADVKKRKIDTDMVVRKANDKTMGEVIFIYQQGWGPEKIEAPGNPRFPTLKRVYSQIAQASIEVSGGPKAITNKIYDVTQNSMRTLNEQYAALVAKRVAGVVVKDVVANKIADENAALGAAAFVAMHLSDRADLRQWSTLPNSFQVARLPLKPGKYNLVARGISSDSGVTDATKTFDNVLIKPGKKVFLGWRTVK